MGDGKYMKKILFAFILSLALVFAPTSALADYFVPQGGGQPVAQLVLNKMVKNPQNGQYVENLTITDAHFLPEQEVTFRIEVRNAGGNELKNVNVKDKLPDFVDFVSGPGNFDNKDRSLNFVIDRLGPGESKTFELKTKVRAEKALPNNQLTCLTNLAQASVNQIFTQDTSVFCIETQVLGVAKELPKTGIGTTVLTFVGSIMLLGLSLVLFKKAKV